MFRRKYTHVELMNNYLIGEFIELRNQVDRLTMINRILIQKIEDTDILLTNKSDLRDRIKWEVH